MGLIIFLVVPLVIGAMDLYRQFFLLSDFFRLYDSPFFLLLQFELVSVAIASPIISLLK